MARLRFFFFLVFANTQFVLAIKILPPSQAQEWAVRRPRGILKVVDFYWNNASLMWNYCEGLLKVDKDNNWIPCLAEDWR